MYPKYQSKALLLASYPLKESDKAFVLFTERFGILHARAAAMRNEKSKLRQKSSGYFLLDTVLLQGKAGWRIVELSEPSLHLSNFDMQALLKIGDIFKILLRFVPKDEENKKLFELMLRFLNDMALSKDKKEIEEKSLLITHDILLLSGYMKGGILYNTDTHKNYNFTELEQNIKKAINTSQL